MIENADDYEDLAADRTVDPNQLDIEAARQPELFFKWAERAIEAKIDMEQKKAALDLLEAKINLECRKTPKKFGLDKVTEGAIAAAIQCNEEYIQLQKSFFDARKLSGLLDKAVEALEQKKRMIEVLITLHGQQYFAGPSVPRDLASAWKEYREKVKNKVNERQVSRARRRTK